MAKRTTTQPQNPTTPQPKQPVDLPATGFVRLAVLVKFIPLSKASIWRKVKNQQFPKPVKLSAHVTAWRVEDVRDYIAAQG